MQCRTRIWQSRWNSVSDEFVAQLATALGAGFASERTVITHVWREAFIKETLHLGLVARGRRRNEIAFIRLVGHAVPASHLPQERCELSMVMPQCVVERTAAPPIRSIKPSPTVNQDLGRVELA